MPRFFDDALPLGIVLLAFLASAGLARSSSQVLPSPSTPTSVRVVALGSVASAQARNADGEVVEIFAGSVLPVDRRDFRLSVRGAGPLEMEVAFLRDAAVVGSAWVESSRPTIIVDRAGYGVRTW